MTSKEIQETIDQLKAYKEMVDRNQSDYTTEKYHEIKAVCEHYLTSLFPDDVQTAQYLKNVEPHPTLKSQWSRGRENLIMVLSILIHKLANIRAEERKVEESKLIHDTNRAFVEVKAKDEKTTKTPQQSEGFKHWSAAFLIAVLSGLLVLFLWDQYKVTGAKETTKDIIDTAFATNRAIENKDTFITYRKLALTPDYQSMVFSLPKPPLSGNSQKIGIKGEAQVRLVNPPSSDIGVDVVVFLNGHKTLLIPISFVHNTNIDTFFTPQSFMKETCEVSFGIEGKFSDRLKYVTINNLTIQYVE